MAYNPFNIFRRNQKAIFAVVTVIIMFVFVLSSGLGGGADFFDWLPRWLGTSKKSGEVLCKIDGEKIYASDLSGRVGGLHNKRIIANRYMLGAAKETFSALGQFVQQQLDQITDQNTRNVLIHGPQAAEQLRMFQMFRGNPEFAPMMQRTEKLAADYAALATSSSAKPVEKEIIRARQYQEMLGEVLQFSREELYFFNAPNRTQNDLIDFMLWQKKADQLGISFTTKDIKELIEKEFYGNFKSDVFVRNQLKGVAGFNMDDCLAAIGEEFRVRTAQAAVLGPSMVYMRADKTFGGTTIFSSPFEVFEYYRENCSPTDYEAFPIPAAAFTSLVTQEPQEQELKSLYDQHKDDEPNPAKETPGFKIPRLAKLEWVSASGAEPYYVKMAEESLKAGELQAKIGSLLTVPFPGMGPGWLASATGPFLPKDPLLDLDSVRSEYNLMKDHHNFILEGEWLRPAFFTEVEDTSVVRPQTLVSALGGMVGSSMTLAGPLPGLGTFQTTVRAIELRDRIAAGMPSVLGAVPGPGMLATTVGGQATMQSLLPKPLPIEVVKPELMKHLAEQNARQLLLNDFKTFKTKVAELSENGTTKNKEPVLKYIAEFIAARGLQHGASDKLRSEWTLEDDPGMAPLREILSKSPHGNAVIQFGKKFFWSDDSGRPGQRNPVSGTYKPEYYPNEPSQHESPLAKPEPKFLVWRTEETRAKQMDFQSAKEQLRAAWKLIKAREIARSRAEAIAAQMQRTVGDVPEMIVSNLTELANTVQNSIADPKIKNRVKVFAISDVCPLTGSESRGGLHKFELRPTSDIPYPTRAMADTLIAERTKPPKTSFVLVDEPKDTYYVVTVKDRKVKSEQEFQFAVFMELPTGMSGGMGQTRQAVMSSYNQNATKKTMESILGLLKQEFKFEATEEQKQKLEEKDKSGIEQ
jgi:hypothetical protein